MRDVLKVPWDTKRSCLTFVCVIKLIFQYSKLVDGTRVPQQYVKNRQRGSGDIQRSQ